jgi:hypothetical protein
VADVAGLEPTETALSVADVGGLEPTVVASFFTLPNQFAIPLEDSCRRRRRRSLFFKTLWYVVGGPSFPPPAPLLPLPEVSVRGISAGGDPGISWGTGFSATVDGLSTWGGRLGKGLVVSAAKRLRGKPLMER